MSSSTPASSHVPSHLKEMDRSFPWKQAWQSRHPRYCLLVFGCKLETLLWLILDGDILHMASDLTIENHPLDIYPGSAQWRECLLGDVKEPENTITHRELRLILAGDQATLTLRSDGWGLNDLCYVVTGLKFAECPQEAPIVHFNGPLILRSSLRKDPITLMVEIGVEGSGEGSFAAITPSVAQQIVSQPMVEIMYRTKANAIHRERRLFGYDC